MDDSTQTLRDRWENATNRIYARVLFTENLIPGDRHNPFPDPSDLGLDDADDTRMFGYSMGVAGGLEQGYEWDYDGTLVVYQDEIDGYFKGWDEENDIERGYSSPDKYVIEFWHGNGAGEFIAAVFKQHGFTVDWDGGEHSPVKVTITQD